MEYNDYELVYYAMENDEEAFNLILSKYDRLIKSMCYRYANKYYSYNIDIDDLVQECRLNLYHSLKNYNPDKDVLFYSFVVLITNRKLSRLFSRYYKKGTNFLEIDSEYNYLQVSDDLKFEPSFITVEKELEEILVNFKYLLDFDESVIFDMRFCSFSYAEIAKLLEVDVKYIDNKLIKIRKMLKKYLLNV